MREKIVEREREKELRENRKSKKKEVGRMSWK